MEHGAGSNGKKLRMWIPLAGAAGAAIAAGALNLDLPEWLKEMTRLWGPGFLMIATIFGGVAYYVPRETVPRFVRSQQDQAVQMGRVADQLQIISGQAGQLHEIKEMLAEMSTTQDVMGERLKRIETGMTNDWRERNT